MYEENNYSHERPEKQVSFITKKSFCISIIIAIIISMAGGIFLSSYLSKKNHDFYNNPNLNISKSTKSKLSVQEVIAKNSDSVVEINTSSTTESFFGKSESSGAGSGVIVKKNGYIATNYHVVEGANKINVTLKNGKDYSAKVVGGDKSNDIAVIKINKSNLNPVTFGDSSKLVIGDMAVAIGNPLGKLGGTATFGIISARDRKLEIDGKILDLLQTDAAISPGNSGGGLFNGNGNLIGIVVAKSSGSGAEGLGFAIPSTTAVPIINDLIKNGHVSTKPAAGIKIFQLNDEQAEANGLEKSGIYIDQVYGKNAIKAGLKEGDLITKLNGEAVNSGSELVYKIQKMKIGDIAKFTIYRDDKELEISVKLEDSYTFENRQ